VDMKIVAAYGEKLVAVLGHQSVRHQEVADAKNALKHLGRIALTLPDQRDGLGDSMSS
jgi:hypothetical protein